jgi:nucleoid-associated protein YgaU
MHNRWQPLVVLALALSAISFHNNSATEQSATTTTTTTTTIQPPTTTESTAATSTTNPPGERELDEPSSGSGETTTPEAGQETSREVVVEGDTLWTIAEAHLARGPGEPTSQEVAEYVDKVAKANRDRLQSGDPDLIEPGETIILPPVAPARPAPEARGNTHDVAEGDSLWTIARDHLAEVRGGGADEPTLREVASYWLRVIEANRDRLASGDPDLIYPGEQIVLPPVD